MDKTEKLTVRMAAEDKQAILDFADKRSLNLSALTRNLLMQYVQDHKGYEDEKKEAKTDDQKD